MKLQPTEDFVLNLANRDDSLKFLFPHKLDGIGLDGYLYMTTRYALFMKQEFTLWDFLPFDEEGILMKEPIDYDCHMKGLGGHIDVSLQEYKQYQRAQERVLFKNKFYFKENDILSCNGVTILAFSDGEWIPAKFNVTTIRDLVKFGLELSETAIEKIFKKEK